MKQAFSCKQDIPECEVKIIYENLYFGSGLYFKTSIFLLFPWDLFPIYLCHPLLLSSGDPASLAPEEQKSPTEGASFTFPGVGDGFG